MAWLKMELKKGINVGFKFLKSVEKPSGPGNLPGKDPIICSTSPLVMGVFRLCIWHLEREGRFTEWRDEAMACDDGVHEESCGGGFLLVQRL